jgi:transaldolase
MAEKTTLQQMFDLGQSPWIDNITRDMLRDGTLQGLIDRGIVGQTSNPTIFQKAISGSKLYEDDLRRMIRQDKSVNDIFDELIIDDIRNAALMFRPVYDRTGGKDGYVSIEVLPTLAYSTEKTLSEAKRLFATVGQPNIFVKIPGTQDGLPAIRRSIAEGININITLLFSVDNYRQVADAYMAGLEDRVKAGRPIDRTHSVASFFVSRVDTSVDKKLDELIAGAADSGRKQELRGLQGKAAIANAKMAYLAYKEIVSEDRWQSLASKGANVQRCLWASTSTKNPDYPDLLYVDALIGAETVDTMPTVTIEAFLEHGKVAPTLEQDLDRATDALRRLEDLGISMDEVTAQLQTDGVKLFSESFEDLLGAIAKKREEMLAKA